LKRIITEIRHYDLRDTAKKVLLIVSSLAILDVLMTVLGAPFLGKPRVVILSDLLFEEGAVIFAIGIFIAVARAWQEKEPSSEPTTEITDDAEQTSKRRISLGVLMLIIGAILIGLSITVGTLLL